MSENREQVRGRTPCLVHARVWVRGLVIKGFCDVVGEEKEGRDFGGGLLLLANFFLGCTWRFPWWPGVSHFPSHNEPLVGGEGAPVGYLHAGKSA